MFTANTRTTMQGFIKSLCGTGILLWLLVSFSACQDDVKTLEECTSLIAANYMPDSLIVGQPAQINNQQPISCSGVIVNYTWSLLAKPTGSRATLNASTNAPSITFVPDLPGPYTFGLEAQTNSGQRVSEQITIIAKDDRYVVELPETPATLTRLTGTQANNRTLTDLNGPGVADYVLDGTYTITGDLIIEPGVEIMAAEGSSLVVAQNGTINTNAALNGSPVIFAAENATVGSWCGIKILSHAANQALVNLVVQHAGGNGCASLQIGADDSSGGTSAEAYRHITLEKVMLINGAGRGLVENSRLHLEINQLEIDTHVGYPVQLGAKNAFSLNSTCRFNNGAYTAVRIVGKEAQYIFKPGNKSVLSKLPGQNFYLFLDDLVVQNSNEIIIEPGVEIQFAPTRGWYHNNGTITAVGNAQQNIVFKGMTSGNVQGGNAAGNWGGLVMGSWVNAIFEYVQVMDFGTRSAIAGSLPRAGIALGSNSRTTVRHSVIGPGDGYGIFNHQSATINEISHNTFTACQQGNMQIMLTNVKALKEGNQFMGTNGLDNLIRVRPGNIDQVTFKSPAPGVGFRIMDATTVNGTLNIAPGTDISFDHDAYFELNGSAQLNAVGTESQLINMFGGTSIVPATWPGFIINSPNTNNTLQYVSISNGGGGSVNPQNSYPSLSAKANLMVTNNGYVNMQNCNISNSATVGVLLGKEASINIGFLHANTFENNAQGPSRRQE